MKIDTLSSVEGRRLLHELFIAIRYKKQMSAIATLLSCWNICVYQKDFQRYLNKDVTVLHKLGFLRGTALWMEEVVNRYYFSTINSFVYFGAAVLLVLIGVRRFSGSISDTVVIAGIAFEAAMLVFMFIVMLFSTSEDTNSIAIDTENGDNPVNDLIVEVGEIGRDFAAAVSQLEQLKDTMKELLDRQTDILRLLDETIKLSAQAVAPNPQMLHAMRETNTALYKFKDTVNNLCTTAEQLKKEEVESEVRRQLELIFTNKITGK